MNAISVGQELYQLMLIDLQDCREKHLDYQLEIEYCYQIAVRYWNRFRNEAIDYEFASVEEEVEFFKTIRPLFLAQIEYCNLVYHSLLFEPTEFEHMPSFWRREYRRPEKFIKEHEELYHYYVNSNTDKDNDYFSAKRNVVGDLVISHAEWGSEVSPSDLVSKILALQWYKDYVEKKICDGKDK
jgi:hypothetical protein